MNTGELATSLWVVLTTWGVVSALMTTATRSEKLFWLVVLAVPFGGFLAWYVFGPRGEVSAKRWAV